MIGLCCGMGICGVDRVIWLVGLRRGCLMGLCFVSILMLVVRSMRILLVSDLGIWFFE